MVYENDETQTLTSKQPSTDVTRPTALLALITHGGAAGPDLSRHLLRHVDVVHLGRGASGDSAEPRRHHVKGRPTLTLKLADARVSSTHAALHRRDDGWTIEDMASKNGTWVDGARVHSPVMLDDRAVIRLGHTAIIFRSAMPLPILCPVDAIGRTLPAAYPPWRTFNEPLGAMLAELAALAPTGVSVVALGETGVGKEVIARGLHALSKRAGALVTVNCAAVSPSLAEAEFFGHARGAFTGADRSRLGWIRSADGGTLFLDEIADLRPSGQAILLRALEIRAVTPVGAERSFDVDFRLVAATNRDLDAEVDAGRFRADLRARLGALAIDLPPLRARTEDIGLLAGRILGAGAQVSAEATSLLARQPWPGNIRQLVHVLELARSRAAGHMIEAAHLHVQPPPEQPNRPVLDDEQRAHRRTLVTALEDAGGNVAAVGRELGAHRQTLHRWFARYGIDPDDYR